MRRATSEPPWSATGGVLAPHYTALPTREDPPSLAPSTKVGGGAQPGPAQALRSPLHGTRRRRRGVGGRARQRTEGSSADSGRYLWDR